ncbi:hypothetical protein B0H15DRAFT_295827 [Mycena belliarum]|uniref:F-box domain-containing protein n=1 Tax=Mycena belliarum TaxID=1033014 RepID=A0AAD6U3P0_9AGAR|nr:hypothetical protein B0H15DRAFT_295827 [Mycena belliae]
MSSPILTLPNELFEPIFRALNRHDLWALARVCSRLRSLALLPFLARHKVSTREILAGVLSVSAETTFLIPLAANIHPIHRLEITRGRFAMASPGILPAALAAVAPIPDIAQQISYGQFTNRAGIAATLAAACSASPTFVFVGAGTVRVSTHRTFRPICWERMPLPALHTASEPTLRHLLADLPLLVPLALASLLLVVLNTGVLAVWLYRHLLRPRWALEDRLAADLGDTLCAPWMRVQCPPTLASAERLAVVTFGSEPCARFTLPCSLGALTPCQRAALLATLQLPDATMELAVARGAGLALRDVLACARRHPNITSLVLEAGSVSEANADTLAVAQSIMALTAPYAPDPYVLPAMPNVKCLAIAARTCVSLPGLAHDLRGVVSKFKGTLVGLPSLLFGIRALPFSIPLLPPPALDPTLLARFLWLGADAGECVSSQQ